MKIIYILLILTLTSCSSSADISFEKELIFENQFNIPVDWPSKVGGNGYYYTNFEDVILINTVEKNASVDSILNSIKKSLSFYDFNRFQSQKDIKVINEMQREILAKHENGVDYISVKLFRNNNKLVYVASISENKNQAEEILYEVTK